MTSPTSEKSASPVLVIIAFTIIYIVWGSTYFFIRIAEGAGVPPFLLGAIRFTAAGLLLMGWCVIKGEKIFVKKDIINASITGILLLVVSIGIVLWVEQTLPSAMVAIVVSAAPIWFVLLDKPNWRINLRSKATIIGLIIGFAGVLLLFSDQIENIFAGNGAARLPWMLLLVFGSMCWSGGSLFSKHRPGSGSAAVNTAWQMFSAGIVYIPITFIHHEYTGLNLYNIKTDGWLALLYLTVFGSIVAFSAYVWLLQVRPATQVSTYAYVNPVIAVFLGTLFAHESISFTQIVGLVVILSSVMLINLSKYRKEKLIKLSAGTPTENELDLVD